ncbi:signal peptide peptidase SppA [Salinarimonas soli]|uniref:Signal peptide peptidase SppA n=1 Tax=Salinarimonas soli TaxID=1638099 RepID=A0A5B2VI96_9HYPH|nr:signal peptide peptidase SppA [Salinarimonas soli]KAA2237907.1 signal peptide peptidase SppA [Salinarimonas soli]
MPSSEADLIADRRRLRRKLSFWRVLAVLAAVAGVVIVGLMAAGRGPVSATAGQIARIEIDGVIGSDQSRMADLFKRVGEAGNVAGVIVSIDSPGGTTTGSEELFRNIRRLSEKKPLVAFVDGTAASGGYIAALGADRILARETSLVGSIGVLFQYPDVTALLDRFGVKVEEIKSSPLKAAPSPFTPTSPEAREALANVVRDTYDWFKGLVSERRKLGPEQLAAVSDGRVHSGRQALALRLVDELGGEREAQAWLEREKGVAKDLPIREWKPKRDADGFGLLSAAAFGADLMGLERLGGALRRADVSDRLRLDGLLALWQPPTEK